MNHLLLKVEVGIHCFYRPKGDESTGKYTSMLVLYKTRAGIFVILTIVVLLVRH